VRGKSRSFREFAGDSSAFSKIEEAVAKLTTGKPIYARIARPLSSSRSCIPAISLPPCIRMSKSSFLFSSKYSAPGTPTNSLARSFLSA
jgi:hypothetical protein